MSNTPNGVVRLTKAQILNGRNHITYEHIDELEGEVPLRPMNGGQIAEIDAIQSRGISIRIAGIDAKNSKAIKETVRKIESDPDAAKADESIEVGIDLEEMSRAESLTNALAVMYGMADGEDWTLDDVNAISPPSAIATIAAAVFRISKVDQEEMRKLKSFRGNE